MGRYWGRLKANKRLQLPTHFIFYDTETYPVKDSFKPQKLYLKLGVACYLRLSYKEHKQKEDWLHFTDKETFWNWVEKKFRSHMKLYLIAHNQNFDAMVVDMFGELPRREWMMKEPIINSQLFIARFTKNSRTLMALDTLNWFKFSLKVLGDFVGYEKLEIDFKECTDEELDVYCKNDVEIMKQAMLKWIDFIREHDLGCFQYTLPSQAFTAFRHRYMKTEVFIHAHPKAIELERACSQGGRNEAFFLGLVPYHTTLVDFNSLYPSVMKNNVFPTKLVSYIEKSKISGLLRAMKNYLVLARVNITVTEPAIAIKRERLLFPVGTFDAALATPELEWVIEHGKINEVYDYALYDYAKMFQFYVDDMYKQRLKYKNEDNVAGSLLTKLFMNSLFGKFGQRVEIQKLIGHADKSVISVMRVIHHETQERYRIKTFGGNVYKVIKGEKEGTHSFPAVACYVLTYARMKLWNAMQLAGRENVFYVDTDSLFVNDEGLKRLEPLIDEKKLGALKIEGDGDDLYIHGLKDYVFLEKRKIKGVKKTAKMVGLSAFRQTRFYKFRSLLIRGSLDAPIIQDYIKHLKREYKKGILHEDGRITPFVLS